MFVEVIETVALVLADTTYTIAQALVLGLHTNRWFVRDSLAGFLWSKGYLVASGNRSAALGSDGIGRTSVGGREGNTTPSTCVDSTGSKGVDLTRLNVGDFDRRIDSNIAYFTIHYFTIVA